MTNQNKFIILLVITIFLLLFFVLSQDETTLPNLQTQAKQEESRKEKPSKTNHHIDIQNTKITPKTKLPTQTRHNNTSTLRAKTNNPKFFQATTDTFKIMINNEKNATEDNITTIQASINNQPFTIQIPQNQQNITIDINNIVTNESKSIKIAKDTLMFKKIDINFDSLNFKNTKKDENSNFLLPQWYIILQFSL